MVERTGGGHWHPSCPDAVVAAGGGAAAVARPRYVVLIGRDGKGLLDLLRRRGQDKRAGPVRLSGSTCGEVGPCQLVGTRRGMGTGVRRGGKPSEEIVRSSPRGSHQGFVDSRRCPQTAGAAVAVAAAASGTVAPGSPCSCTSAGAVSSVTVFVGSAWDASISKPKPKMSGCDMATPSSGADDGGNMDDAGPATCCIGIGSGAWPDVSTATSALRTLDAGRAEGGGIAESWVAWLVSAKAVAVAV